MLKTTQQNHRRSRLQKKNMFPLIMEASDFSSEENLWCLAETQDNAFHFEVDRRKRIAWKILLVML